MITKEKVIEVAKECGWKDMRDLDSDYKDHHFIGDFGTIKRLSLHFYKQGLLDGAAKCEFFGNTYALDCYDALRQMADEVEK